MSPFLRVLENEAQLAALSFMALVYLLRVAWIMSFRRRRDYTRPVGSRSLGALRSLGNIAMPWAMESTRRHLFFYLQFVVFHLGVTAAITLSFVIPYAPGLLERGAAVAIFRLFTGAAFLVGVVRMIRRITEPQIRVISTPDDYFSLALLAVYFAAAFWAAPNRFQASEAPLIVFFGLTAFFLVYVPFSKISHYLYYPFARFFLGRALGHRGALPGRRTFAPSGSPHDRRGSGVGVEERLRG